MLEHTNGEIFKILPLLADIEVSGECSADGLLRDKHGPWTWEDLPFTSGQPIDQYRVYRRNSGEPEFNCIHTTVAPVWPAGGHTTEPAEGQTWSPPRRATPRVRPAAPTAC